MSVVLDRHELLWVLEQCDAPWPYPLRPVHWSAETDAEVRRHRTDTEQALRGRGLLEPAPARLLLDAGSAVAGWALAVDLVRRDAAAPLAAVACTDGRTGALLSSPERAGAPVRVTPCPPDGLAEAVFALVPPVPPGSGPAVPVPAGALPADLPATRRATRARDVAEDLLATVATITQVGVAERRAGADPRRVGPLLCWLDGPRGRHALRLPPGGQAPRPPLLVPATGGQLLAEVRTVLSDAAVPRPPGRSTA
ncbi:ESX secretion-associated protein EspG [Actinomycetospora cinnamomea]|uniref:ESAT-6 protein secretion system EspG family protein n=1 Tax=Actinomycetospora cinnamomea TaxID=663609 RepID=A0A2U1FBS7_9PSEU|nr:ESX secretion-associated protein EspG [Actinomycetospora cinnamomea]PVZ09616.1 ESAT-6 protein secretion system EspG family protein [Actinomycetospora cinnamomea]